MKKNTKELERHHINPALILRRFQNNEKNIIGIMKYDILFNNIITEQHNRVGNDNSNMFIIEKLNFFSTETIEEINNIILSKNIDTKNIEITSLEKSYNYYEDLMGKFIKKYLDKNEEINDIDINMISSYIEMSELRALKYYNSKYLYQIIENNEYNKILNLKNLIINIDDLYNIDSLNLNEKANYINILINFFKINNFNFYELEKSKFSNSLFIDFIKIYNFILNYILKNNFSNTVKCTIHFLKSNSFKFITGDNPVFTIYKNKDSDIFDIISQYLFTDNKNVNKITFMIISPNDLVVRTDSSAILNKEIVEKIFIKILNSLTLYNSDVWIVSKEFIIGKKDKINLFDFKFYGLIKESDFHNDKTLKLLNILNCYTGHLNSNFIFNFNIINPLKELVKNIDNFSNYKSKIDTNDYTDIIGDGFFIRLYKNSSQTGFYWYPDDYTMKFIQHLDAYYTYSIKHLIRMYLSEKLNYTPLNDELQFFKHDKSGVIKEVYLLKDYANNKKSKKLDGLYYFWIRPIE